MNKQNSYQCGDQVQPSTSIKMLIQSIRTLNKLNQWEAIENQNQLSDIIITENRMGTASYGHKETGATPTFNMYQLSGIPAPDTARHDLFSMDGGKIDASRWKVTVAR